MRIPLLLTEADSQLAYGTGLTCSVLLSQPASTEKIVRESKKYFIRYLLLKILVEVIVLAAILQLGTITPG
jgi:hypothetical protein